MSLRYVVTHRTPGVPELHYWYGPYHGWGTTCGSATDVAVATFTSRLAAENALRTVHRTLAAALRRRYRVEPDRRSATP